MQPDSSIAHPSLESPKDPQVFECLQKACAAGTFEELTSLLVDSNVVVDDEDIQRLRGTAACRPATQILAHLFTQYPHVPLEDATVQSAIRSGSTDCFKTLLEIDPNIAIKLPQNRGLPLDWELQAQVPAEFIEFLLKNEADPNNSGHWPSNLFMAASFYVTPDVVNLLLRYGSELGKQNALCGAVLEGHLEVVKYLLENGLRPEDESDTLNPEPVLNTAIEQGFREIIELLLAFGADPCWSHQDGATAFDMARKPNPDMLQLAMSGWKI